MQMVWFLWKSKMICQCMSPFLLHIFEHNQIQYNWDPVRGPPAPGSLWNLISSFNYFLDAPQNNFSYLPAPSTFVNLLPELKSVLGCTRMWNRCAGKVPTGLFYSKWSTNHATSWLSSNMKFDMGMSFLEKIQSFLDWANSPSKSMG